MKQFWFKISTRIDALTLRERMTGFAGLAAVMVFGVYAMVLSPLFARQAALGARIAQQQNNIAGIEGELSARAQASTRDPDAPTRARIADVQAEQARLGEQLRTMQKGLVAPERVVPLLETMLRSNGRLRLVSLRTLPVTGLSEAMPLAPPAAAAAAAPPVIGKEAANQVAAAANAVPNAATTAPVAPPKPPELVYRHGVEMTLQGSYLDMVDYMAALEALPTQLFWGKAALDAHRYPDTRLTLTLFTLSLDKQWVTL